MAIIFKGVKVERDWDGKLKGNLDIKGDFGRATLNLTEELCAKILHVCADNIVEAAEMTATEFRREALQLDAQTVDAIEQPSIKQTAHAGAPND
ncbi:hypothetical protein [Phaeobacter sp. JH209A]|uniref:hypothetical protein n=1 Tax=Phaeobacter sp. JH209A TaxID=3112505 RepID=UPI003A8B183B